MFWAAVMLLETCLMTCFEAESGLKVPDWKTVLTRHLGSASAEQHYSLMVLVTALTSIMYATCI